MTEIKIPVYKPIIGALEKLYVNDCLDSSWISSKGKYVTDFENEFSTRIGVKHATAVCNGTVAIHLAMLALGLGIGDEVIVPTLTYVASVNAISYTGATPVFVDSVADTWQMDPKDILRYITGKTRAIMVVHLYGQSCDMDSIMQIAMEHRLFVIEDCAEAFGTLYRGRHVGTIGDIGTFSFFGNKTITTGEGGMVVTNDRTLMDRARHFKGQGLAENREYWHDVVGYNYRMTNIAAAIGLAQLRRADDILARKRELFGEYVRKLEGTPLRFQFEAEGTRHSYWMVSILVERAEQRDSLRNALSASGIESRPLFYPVHTMPMYAKSYRKHPVAEDLAWRGLNLPSYPELTTDDVDFVTNCIRDFF